MAGDVGDKGGGNAMAELLPRLAPIIFVLLWSTGFIGAKLGLPHAEPFTFLSLRFLITLAILAPVVLAFSRFAGWPATGHSMVTGFLIHGVYLGGVFYAISRGMPAGIAALIVALQPMITALGAWAFLAEKIRTIQVLGLAGGLVGTAIVLSPRLFGGGGAIAGIDTINLIAVLAAVLAISAGTVYQKHFASGLDIRFATFAQYIGSLIPLGLLSLTLETRQIDWTGEFIFALGWLILVLSLGAVGLLMLLIRLNSVSTIASLFYLVPAATAVIAYFLFGETLNAVQLVGMVIVIVSVALATRPAATASPG